MSIRIGFCRRIAPLLAMWLVGCLGSQISTESFQIPSGGENNNAGNENEPAESEEAQPIQPPPQQSAGSAGAERVPEPEPVTIDLNDGNSVPNDIEEQIAWWFGGAGGGGYPDCYGGFEIFGGWGDTPVPVTTLSLEWTVAGLNNDPVSVILTLPDQSTQRLSGDLWDQCITFTYGFGPTSLLGTYQLEVQQGSRSVRDEFMLVVPNHPVGTKYYDKNWFVGFKPYEKIRLLIFETKGQQDDLIEPVYFVSEQWLEADEHGMLLIALNSVYSDSLYFAAIGEESGQTIIPNRPDVEQLADAFLKNSSVARPPIILDVRQEKKGSRDNPIIELHVTYQDADGDAYLMDWKIVSSTLPNAYVGPDSLEQSEADQKRGTTAIGIWECGSKSYIVKLSVRILDGAGNQSNTELISINCP